jgi:predicted nucleotidyltransferase
MVPGQARPDSDVDVLIDVNPATKFDLIDLVGVRNLLGDRLGHSVDMIERRSLKPRLRDSILHGADAVF